MSYNLHIFNFEDIDKSNMSFETTQVQDQHVHYKTWPKSGNRNRVMGGREACVKKKQVCLSCNGRLLCSRSNICSDL